MKTFLSFLFLLGAAWLAAQVPRLVVPIGHTGDITSVAFSPDEKYILTGSSDHTAKLWDLEGREIQTFTGHAGGVNSVGFSPDGKMVLTGSGDNTAKIWDLEGREIQTFSGHGSIVAFSPDGKMVLTGSKDHTAKLWDLKGHVVQTFSGHTDKVLSVAFSPDGKMVLTSSLDKTAKLWGLNGHEIQTFSREYLFVFSAAFSPDGKMVLTSHGVAQCWDLNGEEIQTFAVGGVTVSTFSPSGKMILTNGGESADLWDLNGQEIQMFSGHSAGLTSVAFSPDGKMALTGTEDGPANLWDLNGHEIQTFSGHSGGVRSVAFSPDGKMVLTGNSYGTAKLWDLNGHEIQTFSYDFSRVNSVAFSPDGKTVLTGASPLATAKLWDLNGHEIQTFSQDSLSLLVNSATFSPDGKMVLMSSNATAKLWDLNGHEIQIFSGHRDFVNSVAFSPDGKMVLTGSRDGTAKLWALNGREIQTFSGHTSQVLSVAFSPDGKMVLTGSEDGTAKLWDLHGHEIQTFSGHTGSISSVTFSPNEKFILTGSMDHTAKLWSLQSGQALANLLSIDSTDWVVTTPSGLFDASPGAMKLMCYVQDLDVIELEQLKERYYEPGLLAKIMGFDKSELRNVAAFDKVALYPEIKAIIAKDQLQIQLTERNGGLGKLSLFINDKEVQEDINPKRLKTLKLDLQTFAKYYQIDTTNTLALRAYNAEGWLKSQAYELPYRPTTLPGNKAIPHLYAIVVGTANYAGDRLDLRFPDLDADAMAKAFQSTGSALFGIDHTSVRMLCTAGSGDVSSKTNIQKAFSDIAAKAQPADVLVVYFSGHGLAYGDAEKAQFYYLTKDIGSEDLSDPVVRNSYTISSDEFTKWLTAIPAQKQVMILDACNAGKVVESLAALAQKSLDPSQIRALDRMKDRTGMFILTGSAADKVSYEAGQYGQGLLTYSLLQGMSGLALTEDKRVDVMTLFQFARDHVPELAKGIGGIQTPILAFPAGGASFDIGIVNAGVKIPVVQAKPVFIRNNFQDENAFDDVLGLTSALADYFRGVTAKGAQAEMIYVDVNEYENAWSMKGRYTLQGDIVVVRGKLFRGKEPKGDFEVQGNKKDVPGLVAGIVGKVSGMVK